MKTTITNGTTTYELPAGLRPHTTRQGAAVCEDCGRFEDLGKRIAHSKRCDTATLQPRLAAGDAPRPRFHRTGKGETVVLGPVESVHVGAILEIAGETVTIERVSRAPWDAAGVLVTYGYIAAQCRGLSELEREQALLNAGLGDGNFDLV